MWNRCWVINDVGAGDLPLPHGGSLERPVHRYRQGTAEGVAAPPAMRLERERGAGQTVPEAPTQRPLRHSSILQEQGSKVN